MHPYVLNASVDKTTVRLIIRDFLTAELAVKEAAVEAIAHDAAGRYPGSRVEIAVEEQRRRISLPANRTSTRGTSGCRCRTWKEQSK
ncbi:MAG: hypothetical protein HY048_20460 [Acidobacteria bacterium]|nr:hypothetical protein [Acidobacteriota bacterium]